KLIGPSTEVKLKHKLISGDWAIAGMGQAPIAASHKLSRGMFRRLARGPLDEGRLVEVGVLPRLELTVQEQLPHKRDTIPGLTFGCWLIDQWERVPAAAGAAAMGGP